MSKNNIIFTCTNCDAQFPKWQGRCSECGNWGSLQESLTPTTKQNNKNSIKLEGAEIIDLQKINNKLNNQRLQINIEEIDRVFGGGLVEGSLTLLGGEPGIGKSTLVAQIANAIAKKYSIIYTSGEESAQQVKLRLERLNCELANWNFISETNIEKIIPAVEKLQPKLVIIDSIQTVYSDNLPAEAGSINQIRACSVSFLELAKKHNVSVILIGHITKDGQLAGPKSLEHIVDTVIYLENDNNNFYRLLRATKNRFGSTNELGVLEMTPTGFIEVKNPTAIFLEQGSENQPGTAISCVIEGTRPFLVEIQSLVSKTAFGYPQRKTAGFDLNRLQVLTAVITKKSKINLTIQDVIINLAGGLKITDPGLDLAACLSIASNYLNTSIPKNTLIIGEVGLGGEIRSVAQLELKLKEAQRMGFEQAIIPASLSKIKTTLKLLPVKNLTEAINILK